MHRDFLAKIIKNKNQALVVYFMERMKSKFCKTQKSHFRAAASLLLFPFKEIAPLFSALLSSLFSSLFSIFRSPPKRKLFIQKLSVQFLTMWPYHAKPYQSNPFPISSSFPSQFIIRCRSCRGCQGCRSCRSCCRRRSCRCWSSSPNKQICRKASQAILE